MIVVTGALGEMADALEIAVTVGVGIADTTGVGAADVNGVAEGVALGEAEGEEPHVIDTEKF
jgi:hypothetical protein